MAILNINPTTGAEGELWYLARFVTGLPDWRRIAIGAGGNTILTITTDDGAPPVVADVAGNVNILGGNNLVTAGTGPGNTETIGIDPPVTIPNGGTNAIAMSTVNGIVKYDGTSLVTSTTAKIDSHNYFTNTAQPSFLACLTANDNNVTGNGTIYTVGTNTPLTILYNIAGAFTAAGVFTAPVDGIYFFAATVSLINIATADSAGIRFQVGPNLFTMSQSNPAATKNVNSGCAPYNGSGTFEMTAGQTFYCVIESHGEGADTNGLSAIGEGSYRTHIHGHLVC
jgi:hypothetical protein